MNQLVPLVKKTQAALGIKRSLVLDGKRLYENIRIIETPSPN